MSSFYLFFILLWSFGVFVFIPKKYWSDKKILLKESPSIFTALFFIIIYTVIGFVFSKVLFATLCLFLTRNILEYNVLLNNFYTPEVEHLTPFSLRHFIAFFMLNPLSYFLTFKGLLLLKVRSRFNQSLDLIKIQLFIVFCFISMEAAMYINSPNHFFANFWRIIHNIFNAYLFRLLFAFSIFIGIILDRKFKTGKFNQFHAVIKIKPKWLDNVFRNPKQILLFFILLGLLFLIPSYLRFYGSSKISHTFALFFNGVLLLFFGFIILPNLIKLLTYIINDEKFRK